MRVVPPGWKAFTLADVARWGSGGTPTAGRSDYYGGPIPWAVIGDLTDGFVRTTQSTITAKALAESSAKLVPPGAILIAMYGSIGKLGITEIEMATNQAIAFALPNESIDSRYLFHYLASQHDELTRAGKGATQKNISQTILKSWPVPVPSRDEQRRIVDILEDHLSRLDAANVYLEASHRRTDRLASAALWGLTHGRTDSRVCTLSDVAEVRLGRQRSPSNHTGSRMRRYLRAGNVGWDALRLDDVKEMNFTAAEETIYRLLPGDILVVEASGSASEVGKSAIYDGEPDGVCFQNTLLRVRCSDAVPEFLQKYLLAEAIAGRFAEGSRGVGINHLGRARLAGWTLELPSEDDQRTLAAQCAQALETMAALKSDVTAARTRSATLRRALLAAAFSGRLTGRASDLDLAEEMVSA